jgi:hypothetical protein
MKPKEASSTKFQGPVTKGAAASPPRQDRSLSRETAPEFTGRRSMNTALHSSRVEFLPGRRVKKRALPLSGFPHARSRAYAGLGVGIPVVAASAATGGSIAGTIMTAAGVGGPLGMAVGLGAAAISLIFGFIGGGCGQACVIPSQTEQVFEIAMGIVAQALRAKQITSAEAIQIYQALEQAGVQQLSQLAQTDPKAKPGIQTVQSDAEMYINGAQNLNVTAATAPVDTQAAVQAFTSKTNPAGWYGGPGGSPGNSWQQGIALAEQLLSSVPSASSPAALGNPAASISAKIQAAGSEITSITGSSWFLPAAIGAGVLVLWTVL